MTAAVQQRSQPTTGGRAATRRPKLRVLDQQAIRQRARRRNALLALFVVVLLGFFAVAFVHAQLVAGQQDLDAVRTRIAEAKAYKAGVARAAEEAASPQAIVDRAEQLGMVRAYQPVYLQATAPVREVATIAALTPAARSQHIDLVAPATGIGVGISGRAKVETPAPVMTDQVAAPGTVVTAGTTASSSDPSTEPSASPTTVGVAVGQGDDSAGSAGVSVDVSVGVSLGGTVIASSDGGQPASPVGGSSIAGSRAVAGATVVGNGSG